MAQIAHQSSLRPDHSGTFTKEEIERAREEDELDDTKHVVKLKNFTNQIA